MMSCQDRAEVSPECHGMLFVCLLACLRALRACVRVRALLASVRTGACVRACVRARWLACARCLLACMHACWLYCGCEKIVQRSTEQHRGLFSKTCTHSGNTQ
eukprot:6483858-Amphidinium_carterae.1